MPGNHNVHLGNWVNEANKAAKLEAIRAHSIIHKLEAAKEKEAGGELEAARLQAQVVALTAELAEEKRLRVEEKAARV
jgi:hypothetical protein